MKLRAHSISLFSVGVLMISLVLSACGGGGEDENGGPVISSSDFTPSLEGWEFFSGSAGDSAGVTNEDYGLVAYYDYEGTRRVNNTYRHPAEAPTVSGTWSGEWGGVVAEATHRGDARVAVTIDPAARGFTTFAVVHLDDFPHWGDFQSVPMGVHSNGRFYEYGSAHDESATDQNIFSSIEGWFGGPDQVGVVGAFHGTNYDIDVQFKTLFYGERH